MGGTEPAEAVADAVDHDVAAGVDAASMRRCGLLWRGIADAKGAIEGAVRVAADDAVCTFWDLVVAGAVFGAEAAAPEGDAVSPDGLAAVQEGEGVFVLDDKDGVGGGEWAAVCVLEMLRIARPKMSASVAIP